MSLADLFAGHMLRILTNARHPADEERSTKMPCPRESREMRRERNHRRLFRLTRCLALAAMTGWLLGAVYTTAQSLPTGKGGLRVMTYNVDEGTDFLEVQSATNFNEFLIAVGQTITQVRATNPPVRMQAVAKQIIAAQPELVSLQEVDQWSSGPFNPLTGQCGPTTLEFDMLQELVDALKAQGAHYEIAVHPPQYVFPPVPGLILPGTFLCVQTVNSVAILARTDLDASKFQWSNPQSKQFAAALVFPTPVGSVPLPRLGFCGRPVSREGLPVYWHASRVGCSADTPATRGRTACWPREYFSASYSGNGLELASVPVAAGSDVHGFYCGRL